MAETVIQGRYKLLRRCGTGGTGEVYQAEDLRLKRTVALKWVRGGSKSSWHERVLRLLAESENLAQVDHLNVVAVHDVVEREDSVAIVMEFVKGIHFTELFLKDPMAEHELLGYLRQLVGALEAVHGAGIIHRDVNPRNVLVKPEGIVKLIDFGLSVSIRDLSPRSGGTIGYMAPESLRKGGRIGFGVDVYGLGLIAYRALLGLQGFKRLYGGVKPMAWARWLLSREKFQTLHDLHVGVSPGLSAIIERMMEKDPAQRYPRMEDVRKDLERLGVEPARPPVGPSLVAGMRRLLPTLLARPREDEP